MEKNWNKRLASYTIFMVLVLQTQACRASVLMKYLDILHSTYKSFTGPAWLEYDEMFPMWTAMHPGLSWDRKDSELWTELVTHRWGHI